MRRIVRRLEIAGGGNQDARRVAELQPFRQAKWVEKPASPVPFVADAVDSGPSVSKRRRLR
jgi:hypothetical protein